MQCPQCCHALREMNYEGALIHTCDECGGEFVNSAALTHVAQTRELRFPEAAALDWKSVRPQFGVPEWEGRRTLDCPGCTTHMVVGNYAGDTGIFIDRCPACGGVWLDADELENLQILIEHWAEQAPQQIRAIADQLEDSRRTAALASTRPFAGSRFAFVNALINRLLDAA